MTPSTSSRWSSQAWASSRNIGARRAASAALAAADPSRASARSSSMSVMNGVMRRRAWNSVIAPSVGRPVRGCHWPASSRVIHAVAPSRRRMRVPSALRHFTTHTGS
ncbi:hypothetical protein NBH00_16725 [Paraconexibacter antarcticus]|uniref:Uncharacterized protein n=1 Tax=Paraconexibacter antarcticus TaxID=2949664 RepID=A0ABY5DP77_9ACTN|nr:hypothetical protein [Paraconexibacter antarcticus]UTI62998.1 hypothetical protein NBH00_16725 [Paraconexibacter antarcticus]